MSTTERRLGSGWSFPIAPDAQRGSLAYRSGAAQVRQSLLLIMSTEPGERVMRPAFGCGLRRFLAQPNTLTTRSTIQRDVARAIQQWEPRVVVDAITVDPGPDPAQVRITVRYTHARDGSQGVLVYPFYLE